MSLKTNLISFWPLNESSGTRFDAHGGNHLTAVNSPADAVGVLGRALDLEAGSSQYLTITDAAQVGLDFTSNWAWSVFINQESAVVDMMILTKWNHTANTSYMFVQSNSGNNIDAYMNASGSGFGYLSGTFNHGQGLAKWFHLGMNYRASAGAIDWYVNGAFGATSTGLPTSIANTAAPFRIGARDNLDAGLYGDFQMQHLGVWNRNLSPEEFKILYRAGLAESYPFHNLNKYPVRLRPNPYSPERAR